VPSNPGKGIHLVIKQKLVPVTRQIAAGEMIVTPVETVKTFQTKITLQRRTAK
jgi:hypothetical protein